jgi:hypothetical protein
MSSVIGSGLTKTPWHTHGSLYHFESSGIVLCFFGAITTAAYMGGKPFIEQAKWNCSAWTEHLHDYCVFSASNSRVLIIYSYVILYKCY